MSRGLWALAIGAFGIGMTEFVIAGLLSQIATDFGVGIPAAGNMATGYALGVFVGAPLLTILAGRIPRKTVLILSAAVFTLGNVITACAPTLGIALVGRVVTSLNHGTFFGIGSVIAALLVPPEKRASAIAFMFSGMTMANLAGVPAGTWLAQQLGWRAVFWLIAGIGVAMVVAVAWLIPQLDGGKATPVRQELRAFTDRRVLLAMGITVLGPAAFFTVITYIGPIATGLAAYSHHGVAFLMLMFGLGLVIGNWLGGRYADRDLFATLFLTLGGQGVVLVLFWVFAANPVVCATAVFLMAASGFATVSPIQKLVMDRAHAAGAPTLAASVNIGMFNLGNAIGAWSGGAAIAAGLGTGSPILAGAMLSFAALGLAFVASGRGARPAMA